MLCTCHLKFMFMFMTSCLVLNLPLSQATACLVDMDTVTSIGSHVVISDE
jgi:hypothetical protein